MKAPRTSLHLRVVPGANRPGIVGRHGRSWKVRVSAPAEGGRANEAVLDLLATTLDLPRRAVTLAVGQVSRDKVVQLDGVSPEAVHTILSAAAEKRR